MPKLPLTFTLPLSALIAAAGFSGCGPTDEEDPSMTPSPVGTDTAAMPTTSAPMPSPTPAATPTPTPAATPTPTPAAPEPEAPAGDPIRSTDGPSFAATVSSIFDAKCTMTCHEPGGLLGGPGGIDAKVKMDLTPGAAYAALTSGPAAQLPSMWNVGETLEDSYLWHKLQDTHLTVGGEGARMPLTGMLTAAELAIVQAWIEGGATP